MRNTANSIIGAIALLAASTEVALASPDHAKRKIARPAPSASQQFRNSSASMHMPAVPAESDATRYVGNAAQSPPVGP